MEKLLGNGWTEWGRHVLCELERGSTEREELKKMIAELKQDVTMLKVKSGLWGALGGMIPILVLIGLKVFLND